jgi:hypothetical protein
MAIYMDIFLQDPNIVRLPPEEVRLVEVQVTPQANGRQVKIYIELTPFKKRPNLEVNIVSASGRVAARSSILESMLPKMEFTMHLRQPEPGSEYTLEITVYYQKLPEPSDEPIEMPLPEPMVVDRRSTSFVLPTGEKME